jgi:predicted XRE-type DNA-binding protein
MQRIRCSPGLDEDIVRRGFAGAMKKKRYEIGRHNVFKDIGLPNAEEHLVKAQLVFKIYAIMKERRLKQVEIADLLGIRQPDVSKMLRGEFRQFSVDRLLRFLVALNQDVEIVVKAWRGRNAALGTET